MVMLAPFDAGFAAPRIIASSRVTSQVKVEQPCWVCASTIAWDERINNGTSGRNLLLMCEALRDIHANITSRPRAGDFHLQPENPDDVSFVHAPAGAGRRC